MTRNWKKRNRERERTTCAEIGRLEFEKRDGGEGTIKRVKNWKKQKQDNT